MKEISASTNNLNHGNSQFSVPITNYGQKTPKNNEKSLDQILTVEGSGPLKRFATKVVFILLPV
jgi:hypothetical protein